MLDYNDCPDSFIQAPSSYNVTAIDQNNLDEVVYQSFQNNTKQCKIYDLVNNIYQFDSRFSHLGVHLNISSLQARFDELIEFLNRFSTPPSIILPSETRINVNPLINVSIPSYSSGGVGAYVSIKIKYS